MAKAKAKKPAKKSKKAKLKLSAAAKESVVNIKASEQLASNYLSKKEKLEKLQVDIDRITGERKNLLAKRTELANELEEDAIELARVASGGHFENLFTETGIQQDKSKLTQSPSSVAGQVAAATPTQASPDKPSLDQREKELESVKISEFAKGAILSKLESAGIANGLQLFKWMNDSFPREIKGVGVEAKNKLGDTLTDWWMKHPYEVAGKTTTAAPSKAPVDPDAPLTKTAPEPIADKVRDADAQDVINMQGKLILQVAQRQNEHYCYGFLVKLDEKHVFEQQWFGHYPPESKEQCYREALAAVSKTIHDWKQESLPLTSLKVADEIGLQLIETGKLVSKRTKKHAADSGAVAAMA